MNKPLDSQVWPSLGVVVDVFEGALARDGQAIVADFAPPADHPERLTILCELVRVDLEHRWRHGKPTRLEEYRKVFPQVFEDRQLLQAMAFEEYRLRQQAGERPTPSEYRRRFGLEGGEWPLPLDTAEASPGFGEDFPEQEPPLAGVDGMGRAATAYRAYRRGATDDPDQLEIAFESHHVAAEQAELLRSLDRMDPHAAERLAAAVTGFPKVGTDFLDFHLCGELGRGAFGRVFLARQGDLAGRLVALKVSADVVGEMHALAHLQHTNIVSIYSIHRRGPLQAVCMPYLGATTLHDTLSSLRSQAALPKSGDGLLSTQRSRISIAASSRLDARRSSGPEARSIPVGSARPGKDSDSLAGVPDQVSPPQIERLRGMGYVQAVLWLMARVAEGLAHAHDRGILHRDLKPANILFSDDGEPVLLDFNLAADTKARFGASLALVGGTLPYMAPEHLADFQEGKQNVDARSDVYALGVILFELLTGNSPFPIRDGLVDVILPRMIADRRGPLPDARRFSPSVSPAVASIVRHCLEPDSLRRYQSARELEEDLRRQLDNLPLRYAPEPSVRERLRKWARRHPRLTSSTTVGIGALLLLAAVGSALFARIQQLHTVEANSALSWLASERKEAISFLSAPRVDSRLVEEGMAHCQRPIERYGVLDDPDWLSRPLASFLSPADRARLRRDLGDLLILWSQALTQRATMRQITERAQDIAAAATRLDRAETCYDDSSAPRALLVARANLAQLVGETPERVAELRASAKSIPVRTDRERLILEDLGKFDPDALRRESADELRRLSADLRKITEDDPQNWALWVAVGNWNIRLHRPREAEAAYTVAVTLAPRSHWPRYHRGLLYLELKDYSQALEDFDRLVALQPELPAAYLNRALARLGLGDSKGAIDDVTACLGLKGASSRGWFIRAEAKRRLGDFAGSKLDREEGLKHLPDEPAGFVARGLARLPADPRGALADFDAALAIEPFNREALQDKASVLGETLGKGEEALKVLDTLILHHPENYEAICGRGVQLARFGRRDAAIRDARAATAIDTGAQTIYQVACIYSLLSRKEPSDRAEALRHLAAALRQDDSWLAIARRDPDMAPVRDAPAFQELLKSFQVVQRAGK